jgi:zinc protease
MSPHRLPLLVALLALAGALPAAAQPGGARSTINIPFERMTLPNGLQVVLAPDHSVPQVAVNLYYHVGSKNEVPGRTGFAHLFEHVMFTGSAHVPYGMHDRLTEGVGGTNNGSTNNDRTNYYEVVPSNYLESQLWMESDRMGFLLDKLDETKFATQREVVQNERRQRTDNQPYGRAYEITDFALHPASNPYSWPIVGYLTDLQHASVDDVKQFFRQYYSPSNATMTIAGDFEPAAARALVTKYFAGIPHGPAIRRPQVRMTPLAAEKRLTFEDRVQVPRLYLVWQTATVKSPDAPALAVLQEILGKAGSRTARLSKALIYDRQSASALEVYDSPNEDVGSFLLQVTPRPGHSLTEIEATTDSVIAQLKADGPSSDEIARALASLEFAYVAALQSNLGKSDILNDGLVFHGDAGYYKKEYAELKAVTPADVKRVANKYLIPQRVVLSVVPTGKPDQAAKAAASTLVTVAPDGGHYILGTTR